MGNQTYTEVVLEMLGRQEQMEGRLISRLDALNDKIEQNGRAVSSITTSIQEHGRRLTESETAINSLERSDRLWAGINATFTAIGSTIAAILGMNR